MTQEEKDLLLKDLCARLPHGVKIQIEGLERGIIKDKGIRTLASVLPLRNAVEYDVRGSNFGISIDKVKPYLRPMFYMTEEEKKEYQSLCEIHFDNIDDVNFIAYYFDTVESFDWLNKNMFDYRGLIPKDLALSTEMFNPYKD